MTLSYLKVIGVVGGSDLYHAGSEFPVNIRIRNNGDLSVHNGKQQLSAYNVLISFILRIYGYCGIAKHGFRPCGGKLQKSGGADRTVFLDQRIFDMPEMACLLFILYLCVRNGGITYGTPVNDPAALIDPAFFMHLAENFRYGLVAALIHGEALSVPVTGGAQFL